MSDVVVQDQVHDLLGVGFGPSNLALAIAVAEHNNGPRGEARRLGAHFVERQVRFGWHRGMLIEDARMQVSFLKDLATLRNPTSGYSFLNYLHERGRLVDFLNCQSFFPTRLEFHDYLEWASRGFADQVDYGSEVVGLRAADARGATIEVLVRAGGELRRHLASNVVIATGLSPVLPEGVELSARVWHSRDLVPNVAELQGISPARFTVVGAGQSAAESVEFLHRTFPGAEVNAVFGRYGYSPADDSSFANRVFDPAAAEDFFTAPSEVKTMLMGYHRNTNYGVVDPDLIESLYARHYAERVSGRERLRLLKASRVVELVDTGAGAEVVVESMIDGSRTRLVNDAVVYATGYRSGDPTRLLGNNGFRVTRDADGRAEIGRDYRMAIPGIEAAVYVQGATEHTHGISSTLLSNAAVRSGDIVTSILARTSAPVPLARSR